MQMLVGAFSAKGVLPEEFKPAHSVRDPPTQHLVELAAKVERDGIVLQTLGNHFARAYRAILQRRYKLDVA
jgi:hypothetical protein